MSYIISIVLDTRREKENGKFPVKLRVYNKANNKKTVKLYSLDIDLTEKEFETIWINPENKSLRGANKKTRLRLLEFETRANDEAEAMTVFDIAKFETKYFRKSSDKNNVKYHFNLAIQKNMSNDKIGTAESYKYTLNSLAVFIDKENANKELSKINKLTFDTITADWLKEYEKSMLAKGRSYTTIGIYTKALRAIFNNAIEANDISIDIYPFTKNKYRIPKSKKVKKALNAKQLKTLFGADAENENEQQAKDFWFFSYASNGMNFKDIALLKYSDIKDDKFTYYRAKTFDKSAEKTAITIYLTDFTNNIISNYGNKDKSDFVFNIITSRDSIQTQYKKIKNFTRLVNDHIKRIAKRNDLPNDISTYWARHSFATNSLRKGASMEFVSEALNHSDLNVTKNYFAGFEDEAKKEFANSLLDF
ncbi:phage integrase SAM-like domain-containing protein [uncultured Gelidibacter sp.]|uniref:tyrosine-type recombinase/integrase n=1 Tax=uncultured Gelidibacter sp. TaxID=259318 RepID=UPI0026262244|nr:phage integrase SAM-like domain-containing protein [uncultured Gelidibacter sp.]